MTENEKIIEETWPNSASSEILPFESWGQLKGESCNAYAAFCIFRDFENGRSIKTVIDSVDKEKKGRSWSYGSWRKWAVQFRWHERAADYDKYKESIKQTEFRKTIEAQAEKHRQVTGKMFDVVNKKLDLLNPEELTQGTVTEWVQVAVKVDREAANSVLGIVTPNGKTESKQGEFNFLSDFQGL